MAIAFNAGSALAAIQTAAVGSWSHTCTGSDLVLIVGVTHWHSDNTAIVSGVTYNSVALTQIRTDIHGADDSKKTDLWYLLAPATGSNTVEVTMNKVIGNKWGGCAVSLTGVAALDADNGASGTGTTITVDVTTVADNAWVVDNIFDREQDATSNQTLRAGPLEEAGFWRMGMASFGPNTPAGAVTMSWSKSNGEWLISAASFSPANNINTESRRRAVITPNAHVLMPVPDGTIAALDRQQAAWIYSGIAAAGAPIGPAAALRTLAITGAGI